MTKQIGVQLMRGAVAALFFSLTFGCDQPARKMPRNEDMVVRISEIDIDPLHLDDYKSILKEEAAASVDLEPGVISIFPMYRKDNPAAVRILEIYASREAYESHLKTPHFQKYKTTTQAMVKSLRLVDMDAMDAETMTRIFAKMKGN
jgi:quinol monooxygenase YgiN